MNVAAYDTLQQLVSEKLYINSIGLKSNQTFQ